MTLSRRSLLRSLLGGAALAATATLGRVCAPMVAAPEVEEVPLIHHIGYYEVRLDGLKSAPVQWLAVVEQPA